MKTGLLFILFCTSSFIFFMCNDQILESGKVPSRQLSSQEKKIASSAESFGLNLIKKVNEIDISKNIFISPLSISYALGITLNGANGSTYDAIKSTLFLANLSKDEINKSYKSLTELLTGLDPKAAFSIANSIWFRQGYELNEPFINTNKIYFDAAIQSLNFTDHQSAQIINSWVDEKTKGKISEIVTPPISPETFMFLINAIYFKGTWTYQFDPNKTYEDYFTLSDGNQILCNFMVRETNFKLFTSENFQSVELPYGNDSFSMVVILPHKNMEFNQFISQLNSSQLSNVFNNSSERQLKVYLPKFTFSYELSLNDILKQSGMEIAFDPDRADFSGIYTPGGLYISEVKHKTFIKVDEEGSEAAAVTSVEVNLTSTLENIFLADHPFLFIIKENQSNTILFMGIINEPKTEAL